MKYVGMIGDFEDVKDLHEKMYDLKKEIDNQRVFFRKSMDKKVEKLNDIADKITELIKSKSILSDNSGGFEINKDGQIFEMSKDEARIQVANQEVRKFMRGLTDGD